MRALWRLVIYLDLKEVIRPREGQESEVWVLFTRARYMALWGKTSPLKTALPEFKREEMWCVLNFLHGISEDLENSDAWPIELQSLPTVKHNI